MKTTETNQETLDMRLKEMEEENELLLLQLHQVQEELEHYYLRNKELENGQPVAISGATAQKTGWVDDDLPDIIAENQRLRTMVEVQQKVHRLEAQNALSSKLGNILIQSVDSPGSLMAVPGKLGKIWRESNRKTPPKILGGKGFDKVIEVYQEGGFEAVEKLILSVSHSPFIQASAYTALARYLRKTDWNKTVDAARLAHELDPQPYRLKWLAFRLHEAGEIVEAEAMLDLLPADTSFSDSEERQASQLRYEAKYARLNEAKQNTRFSERRDEAEKQLAALVHERDKQNQLEEERSNELDALKEVRATLEEEKIALKERLEEQVRLTGNHSNELDALKEVRATLEEVNAALVGRCEEQMSLVEEYKEAFTQLNQEKAAAEKEIQNLNSKFVKAEKEKGGLGAMIHDLVPFFYGRRLTYVDIGAYIGDVFIGFANSELSIREAHLIEPNAESYSKLIDNTSSFQKGRSLYHYCIAIDKEEGQVRLLPRLSMTKTLQLHSQDVDEMVGEELVIIDATSLDLLIDRITENHIDILKIDVEGYESNVLNGAQKLLDKQMVDVVIIEVGMNPEGKQQCYYREIDNFMMKAGYRIFKIYDQMYEWMSDSPFMRRANFVYMSEKFASSSPYKLTHQLYEKEKIIESLKSSIIRK